MKKRKQKKQKRSKKQRAKKQPLSDQEMAICHDCSLPITWRESYIVRPEVWQAAGMPPKGGYLHLACLETRIGRKLETADFLLVYVGETPTGIQMKLLDREAYFRFNEEMGY